MSQRILVSWLPLISVFAVLSGAPPAHASFPAGVWARVDAVSFEPDAKDPQRVRVDGTFMVAHGLPDSPDYPGYSEPQVGYMYYACDGKQLAVCVMEWNELATIAGTEDRCRGWGDSSLPDNGSVRAGAQKPMDPDLYPIASGVLQGFTPCEVLKAWEMSHGTTGTTSESEGGDTGTATGGASTGGITDGTGDGSSGGDATGGGETAAASSEGGGESKGDTGNLVTTGDGGGEGTEPTGSSGGGGSTGANGDAGSAGEAGEPAVDDGDKGCACRSGGEGQGAGALIVVVALGLVRRRRSAGR